MYSRVRSLSGVMMYFLISNKQLTNKLWHHNVKNTNAFALVFALRKYPEISRHVAFGKVAKCVLNKQPSRHIVQKKGLFDSNEILIHKFMSFFVNPLILKIFF